MNKALTKQDILEMFAKNSDIFAKSSRELDKSIKKEREERLQSSKDFDERMKKLDRQLGNIGNNNGDIAEDFFFNGLEKKKRIGAMIFDFIDRNVKRKYKKLEGEYDIILTNSDTIAIVEVKYKFHPDDVNDLYNRKIPNFRKLFPIYKDFKIYGAIAGLCMPDDTKKSAIEKGFFVLTQSGDNIMLLNEKVKCY